MHCFPIEKKILNTVSSCVRNLYGRGEPSNSVWTFELKAALYELCKKQGLQAWGTGAVCREWLWDVAWVKVGHDSWKDFHGIYLACEIEWGRGDAALLDDFLKLVVAKADYRLFIFEANNEACAEEYFAKLMNVCPASEGARYMAIAVTRLNSEGNLPHYTWTL